MNQSIGIVLVSHSAQLAAGLRELLAQIGSDRVPVAVAALGRRHNVDPETALRKATARFAERFDRMKAAALAEGVELGSLSDDELVERFRAAR